MNTSNIIIPNIKDIPPSTSNKLDLHKFSQYLDNILQNANANQIETCSLYSPFISDYYIIIDFTTFKYIIPNHIIEKLKNCGVNTRYYVIPIMLQFNESMSHANIVIIDNKNKTIELYEPHGTHMLTNNIIMDFDTEYHIRHVLNMVVNTWNFVFKNVHNKCPIGFQNKQSNVNRESSLCVSWILFFIHTRMLNLDKSSDDIIEYFDKFKPIDLDLYIRKYTALIELETSKYNKKFIKDTSIDFELTPREIDNAKLIIKKNVEIYLSHVYDNIYDYNGLKFFDDIKKLFGQFIVYNKFEFFDNLYFQTIETFFNMKQELKHKKQKTTF